MKEKVKKTKNLKDGFYLTRSNELRVLLEKSQSNTSKCLIEEAIRLTNTSYEVMVKVNGIANEKRRFYESKQAKFDASLATMNVATSQMKKAASNEYFSVTTRNKIQEAYEAMWEDIHEQYDKHTSANKEIRNAIAECSTRLKETLIEQIYKPDSSSFVFESISAILTTIAKSLIPYSDSAEILLELSVSKRKKDYLSSGDKILSYLEDYNSILNTWLLLSDQYEKEVLS